MTESSQYEAKRRELTAKILDKVVADPAFRNAFRADPTEETIKKNGFEKDFDEMSQMEEVQAFMMTSGPAGAAGATATHQAAGNAWSNACCITVLF